VRVSVELHELIKYAAYAVAPIADRILMHLRVAEYVVMCRIGRAHRGTGDTIASRIGYMKSMTGTVDMTSDRDTTGSLKSLRRLKEVGAYAIPS
jgi:hypothetical protein